MFLSQTLNPKPLLQGGGVHLYNPQDVGPRPSLLGSQALVPGSGSRYEGPGTQYSKVRGKI